MFFNKIMKFHFIRKNLRIKVLLNMIKVISGDTIIFKIQINYLAARISVSVLSLQIKMKERLKTAHFLITRVL